MEGEVKVAKALVLPLLVLLLYHGLRLSGFLESYTFSISACMAHFLVLALVAPPYPDFRPEPSFYPPGWASEMPLHCDSEEQDKASRRTKFCMLSGVSPTPYGLVCDEGPSALEVLTCFSSQDPPSAPHTRRTLEIPQD